MEIKVLSNGLHIVLVPRNTNTIAVVVGTPHGGRTETAETNGLTHLVEHLITRCSRDFPTVQTVERVMDRIDGEYDAEITSDLFWLYLTFSKQGNSLGFEVLFDTLLHPVITKAAVAAEKGVVSTEITEQYEKTGEKLTRLLDTLMYKNHPLALPCEGSIENIASFTTRQAQDHRRRIIKPKYMVVVVVGGFDPKKVFARLKGRLGRLRGGVMPIETKPYRVRQRARRIHFERSKRGLVEISLGFHTVPYNHKDRPALALISNLLGGRNSSPLYAKLREKGRIYRLDSSAWHWSDTGRLVIETATRKRYAARVIVQIMEELRGLRERLVPPDEPDELDLSKANILAKTRASLDDSLSVAKSCAGQLLAHGEIAPPREWLSEIKKVSRRRLREVARRTFENNRLNLAVLGPVDEKLKQEIRRVARI